jgi:hypothetical protein
MAAALAILLLTAAGAYWATVNFRLIVGPDWISASSVLRRRTVRLDQLVKVEFVFGSQGRSYIRLHDAEGGRLALERRTTLPPVRDQVLRAIADAAAEGRAVATDQALQVVTGTRTRRG